jgi:hypothetical protein
VDRDQGCEYFLCYDFRTFGVGVQLVAKMLLTKAEVDIG